MKKSRYEYPVPEQQVDSVTIIANPVSGTKYGWRAGPTGSGAELGAQKNVRIISIEAILTWATTQPTPLEVHAVIDLETFKWSQTDPVSVTPYFVQFHGSVAPTSEFLETTDPVGSRSFLVEGRSAKIEIEITWATTQPTDLTLRVKWARW